MESNDLPRFEPIDRQQIVLEPLDIEQLIPEDHAARNIWGLLGGLDLSRFLDEVKSVEGHAGRNTWEPRLLIAMGVLLCVLAASTLWITQLHRRVRQRTVELAAQIHPIRGPCRLSSAKS